MKFPALSSKVDPEIRRAFRLIVEQLEEITRVVPDLLMPAAIDKTIITADATDTATILNIVDPTIITVDGHYHKVTNGAFKFNTGTAGSYLITLSSSGYRDKTFTVTAT